MKKIIFLFGLLLCFCLFSEAQFNEVAAGPAFAEPHSEYSKFLLMKNGNLVFAEVGFRDSILIRIYNAAHQEIAVTSYAMSSPAKRKYLALTEAFEINGDAVLFISTEEEKAKILYRVIVDSTTGQVKKEEKIYRLEPESKNEMYALDMGRYHVSKGTDSDNYAVVYCNNFRSEKIKRIEVLVFNKEHIKVSRSFYETDEKEFEYLELYSMKVFEQEKVALLFAGQPWKGGEPKIFLGLVKKGVSVIAVSPLDVPVKRSPASAQMDYDSFNKRIVIAPDQGPYYSVDQFICFIDPETGKTDKMIKFNFSDALQEKGKAVHGRKYTFFGKPVKLLPGKEGSFSVVYEEDDYTTSTAINSNASYSYNFTLDIVVADFDKNGKLISNYLIPKKYLLNSAGLFYGGGFGNQYRTFAYIKNADNGYLFINDIRVNIERLQDDKEPKQVSVINDCDAFYFPLTGGEAIPPRKYLYKETGDQEEHIQSPFGVSVYDQENDVFITLRLNREHDKKTKTVNVVWLKPQ